MKIAVITGVSIFCIFCAAMAADVVFHHPQEAKDLLGRIVPLAVEAENPVDATPAETAEPTEAAKLNAAQPPADLIEYPQLAAVSAKLKTVTLGALYDEIKRTDDPDKYKFFIELTSQGAAVKQVILSEFKSREETKQVEVFNVNASSRTVEAFPLVLLSPLSNGREVYSLANTKLWIAPVKAESFSAKAFPLDKLNWQLVEPATKDEVRFEAELKEADTGEKMLKVVKTYRIQPGSYDLDCRIDVENLSTEPMKIQMQVRGPGGILQEGTRSDTPKVKVAYQNDKKIEIRMLTVPEILSAEKAIGKPQQGFLVALKKLFGRHEQPEDKIKLPAFKENSQYIWSALTNKYFAAIVRPVPAEGMDAPWLQFHRAQYFPSATNDKENQNCSYDMTSRTISLAAAGSEGAGQSYSLAVYLGPKDKKIFEKNDIYRAMQYFQTVDFSACCCPVSVIAPLAFGIVWLMNAMFTLMGPLGNYGVVIIFLVFLVRLVLHPITKKSQVSMMKMQKLGPKMKEIQAKYAGNKQEMNKQVMAMYKEQGASPVSGMLPMFLQMPIWIALWTAVNTSIDLRGAGFLPFWITDLASPDHLFRLPFGLDLPFIGKYFNLLPILMGVVMYLQQKMMPAPQTAQPDSQMAQQQKMMMIMMPLMFPIMLYSGPSGVNLYIMASTAAGVIEQKVIRKHLKEREELEAVGKVPVTAKTGGKFKKKKPKPFFKG